MKRRKRISILVIALICSAGLVAQKNEEQQFKYTSTLMQGQWHIVASNFSTWTQGAKTDPGNFYSDFKVKGHKLRFSDLLVFDNKGKKKKIKGRLRQKKSDRLFFVWRGKGVYFLFKSKWQIIASDSEGQWIALYSPGTLTSPEGVDVMSRHKKMPADEVKKIVAHLEGKYVKKALQVLK